MKIRELTLENFGVVKGVRTYKFAQSGVIGICGANGTGKTHIIRALRYVLFNDPGCILCYIVHNFGRDPDIQEARVKLVADVGEQEFTIERSVRIRGDVTSEEREASIAKYEKFAEVTSKAKLVCGEEKIGAAARVQERLYELVGLRDAAAQDVVFVPQGQTGAVLCKTRADRVDALQKLSGVGVCASLLSEARAKGQQVNVVDRSEDLDVVSSRFGILAKELEELGTPNVAGLSAELQSVSTELEGLEARKREQEALLPLAEELEQIHTWFDETKEPTFEGTPASHEDVEGLRNRIREWETQEEKKQNYVQLDTQLQGLRAKCSERERALAEVKGNPPAVSADAVDQLREAGQKLRIVADTVREVVKIFDETGKCPTCGSEPQGGPEVLAEKREQLARYDARLATLREEYMSGKQVLDAYLEQVQTFTKEIEEAQRQKEKLQMQRDQYVYEAVPEGELGKLRDDLAKTMYVRDAYEKYLRELSAYQAMAVSKTDRREYLNTKVVGADWQDYTPAVTELRNKYADIRTRLDGDLAKQGKLEGIRQSFEDAKAEKDRLEGLQKDVAIHLSVKQYMDSVVGLMHRDALPRSVARYYFKRLNALFERYADEAGAPFRIRLDPETYEFMADFPEGSQPVSMLSGGQFTMAAWVYHLAMYEKHAAQAGLLAMDEPTNGLDKANMLKVQEVLYRVNSYCERANLQMLLVTHEEDLLPACSQVAYQKIPVSYAAKISECRKWHGIDLRKDLRLSSIFV